MACRILKLGVISAFAPWLCYFGTAAVARVLDAQVRIVPALSVVFFIPSVVVFGGAVLYGRRLRWPLTGGLLLKSLIAAAIVQFLGCFALIWFGAVPEPYKIIMMFPFYVIFSWFVLLLIWLGSVWGRRSLRQSEGRLE